MPLIKSGSEQAKKTNIREMIHSGYPQRVAVAAALSTARKYGKKYAAGGKVDRSHDIPYIAGISKNSHCLYVDKRIPKTLTVKGKTFDPAKYLRVHETHEHMLMTKHRWTYEKAHQSATQKEKAAVKADGIDWNGYEAEMRGYADETEHEKHARKPKNLYLGPYKKADGGPVLGPYDTKLSPPEETAFKIWKRQNAPNDTGEDYDLRGAFKSGLSADPQTQHWDDTFKKPNHPTFSNFSQYAKDPDVGYTAGTWNGDEYVPSPVTTPYAEGGEVEPPSEADETQSAREAAAQRTRRSTYSPRTPGFLSNDLIDIPGGVSNVAHGMADWAKTPGEIMKARYQGNETPGMLTEEDVFRSDQANKQAQEWGAGTALGMVGSGTAAAKVFGDPATLGTAGIKPPTKKTSNEILDEIHKELLPEKHKPLYDLHPDEVKGFKQASGPLGSNPGGLYEAPNGQQWYIKNPQTKDHAMNEKLATELYKLAGVPTADLRLTELNGKAAVASPIIEGKTLNNYDPVMYPDINGLREHFPADAWLANYDSIGLEKDNIIVDAENKAHRIDMGGALRYRAQGKPKADWGSDVKELDTMRDPKINPNGAEVFGGKGGMDQMTPTAQRIAAVPDHQIQSLVQKYGPNSQAAKDKLAHDLMLRRDQIAEYYSLEPSSGGAPPPVGAKGLAKDTAAYLMKNHGDNPSEMANLIYDIANKHGAKTADAIMRELPQNIKNDVDGILHEVSIDHGYNPWTGKHEESLSSPERFEDFSMPKPEMTAEPLDPNHPLQKAIKFDKEGPVHWDGEPTVYDNYNPSEIADHILGAQLTTKQIKNVMSWMSPELQEVVDNSIAAKFGADTPTDMFGKMFTDITHNKKMEDPHYVQSVERDRQDYVEQMRKHLAKPSKSLEQMEADRIAGKFTTPAFKGVSVEHGIEHPERAGESFQSDALDVAHAYSVWKNSAADVNSSFWDKQPYHDDWKHAAIQPMWLNTEKFVVVDAGGKNWEHGNDLAARMRFELEAKGEKPTGAIIKNVHDMPHDPYQRPTGEPMTVYWAWDPSVRRSKYARFDREFWGKAGLPLSVSGLGLASTIQSAIIKKQEDEPVQKKASGGKVDNWVMHQASRNLHAEGAIKSPIPGRTDKIPASVPRGAYVLTADTISHLGQSNTEAGQAIAKSMFSRGPMGMAPMQSRGRPSMPRLNMRAQSPKMPNYGHAEGGGADGDNEHVPVILAGGEAVVHPDVVRDIGHGSITAGHKVLDKFQGMVRADYIKTLSKLKPPKQ